MPAPQNRRTTNIDSHSQVHSPREAQPNGERSHFYLSVQEAADRASVSTDTVRRMISSGQLKAYRFRGQIRIAIEDFHAAMRPIR
ncbi:excisionase family DNA-binding protein [Nocardia sp. NPDC055321]